jgi:hypothetical protein
MIFGIVDDTLAYTDLNPAISLDLVIFLCSFLALFLFNGLILLEVKAIRQYIKKRGEK